MAFLGFLVLFLVILAATAGTSSDRDGRRRHNGSDWGYGPYSGWYDDYHPPYPPPHYPPYGYPPYRRNRLREWLIGFIVGIVVVSLVVGGFITYISQKATEITETMDEGEGYGPISEAPEPVQAPPPETKKGGEDAEDWDELGKPVEPEEPQMEEETPPRVSIIPKTTSLIRVAVTSNETIFKQLRKEHGDLLQIEGIKDVQGRIIAVVFAQTPEEKRRVKFAVEEANSHSPKFYLQYYELLAGDVCLGKIVGQPHETCWFCEE